MKRNFIKIFAAIIICFSISHTERLNAQIYNWSQLGTSAVNGTNGKVNAITSYNGSLVLAGAFTYAGSTDVRNIAMWNGNSWTALGTGIGNSSVGDTVYSLAVYNGVLYAGGNFTYAGGIPASNIAKWNGTSWSAVSNGINGQVNALLVYNSKLYAGGEFDNAGTVSANRIARWNGTSWADVGGGFNTNNSSKVFALATWGSKLVVGGRFNTAGGNPDTNVAGWNDTTWSAVGSGFGTGSDRIFALTVNNNVLYCGGKSSSEYNIAYLSGTTWRSVGGGVDNDVNTLASYKGNLIVGGNFRRAGGVYVDRIALWDGVTWNRMLTGMNEKVNSLFSVVSGPDTILYAGGEFTTSGGKSAKHISQWKVETTSTVAGLVKYSDNNQPVITGKAKILRRDINTQEVIVVDSVNVVNGSYLLPVVPRDDGLKVVIFPNDVLDFVPTYFPSTVDWAAATPLTPVNNLTNINVTVYRMDTTGSTSSALHVGGYAYLNFIPPAQQPGNFPYNSDAIIYLKQGNTYKGFGVSNTIQQYNITHVPPGTYSALVYRAGYQHYQKQITVSAPLDTVNFYLDTSTVAEVHNISSQLPEKFNLEQNYPNPFNPETKIKFSVITASFTELNVFNTAGQKVARLVSESLRPGEYEVVFNASSLPSGVYFYSITSGNVSQTKKMVLLK